MKFSVYCFLIFMATGLISCKSSVDPAATVARHGVLDLSTFDIAKKGKFALDGEWEFYYNQLLYPADFKQHLQPNPDVYAMIPGYWNNPNVTGSKKFSAFGYATYRLTLTNFHFNQLMALRMWESNSAYRLWVNDSLVAAVGTVSANADSIKAKVLPLVKPFAITTADSVKVILQVANASHVNGGIKTSIEMGAVDAITSERDNDRIAELSMAAIMLILFVYHLFIFLLRRKEYAALWYALLCLDSAIRDLVTGEYIFYTTFPNFSYAVGLRIEYLTITMGVPLYVMLAYEFFKKEWSVLVRNIILIICAAEFVLIVFSPVRIFSGMLNVIQGIVLLECFYLIYIVIRAMMNRRDFAIVSFISYCICFIGIVHDTLAANLIINSSFIIFYTFSVFLLMQAYILAYRNSAAYKKIEFLSLELNEANITLEKKVEDRTAALNLSNNQLLDEKRKSDALLLNILPADIAEELRNHGSSKARRYPSVTVMFTDFKDFTRLSEELTPEQLVSEIDLCYRQFDAIIEQYGLEKIKTMGDAYICAGGLPVMNFTHPEDVVNAALDIRDFMLEYRDKRWADGKPAFQIRIGVHTGPVVAGIVGSKKFAYDIWGDTVNLGARMESSGEVGKVNVSLATYQLTKDKFNCTHRGKVDAKNKGAVDMYFVERK